MSNYNLKAKHKVTGEIVQSHLDDDSKYVVYEEGSYYICDEKEFNELYEVIEDPNHPYGGLEVEDNVPTETLQDRFNKEFVDEDTGVLNIGKYDHERLLAWINNEIKK